MTTFVFSIKDKETGKVMKTTVNTVSKSLHQEVVLEARFESAYDARDLKFKLDHEHGLLKPTARGPSEKEKIKNAAGYNIGKVIRKAAKFTD